MPGRYFRICIAVGLCVGIPALAATRRAGKGKPYATPCAAIAAASDGDTILIDAGSYPGDVCGWRQNRLNIRSVGGRARIDAQGKAAMGKGIWVAGGDNTTIEGIEFSGATVESNNGAGIRLDGRNLTVRDCYFHHNQNGILTGNEGGNVLVEYSEFADNGAGDGYSHNMYIGVIDSFTIRYSYSHRCNVGHLVKSRAAVSVVEYNRLTDETGTASYELDFPNGGLARVVGNYFQQSPRTSNPHVMSFLSEGTKPQIPGRALYVVNNTFVNEAKAGTVVLVNEQLSPAVVFRNNLVVGFGGISNSSKVVLADNIRVPNAQESGFVEPARYDYRLKATSPAIDAGRTPGMVDGLLLTPVYSFAPPTCRVERSLVGKAIDVGADEFGNKPPSTDCGPAERRNP